ncbi:SMALL NUCLEAR RIBONUCLEOPROTEIN (U1/U2 snRNP) [Encephalitozoon cuniculi GB-M1]|uniref:SMALL NUCLEAR RIBONUCLEOPROTEIN (U1/U2 snRNP) n=2 Tax=Encephalitozoon cuniculi TaxID=6035 RepID=Q8SSM1_ENCCU|nr:small nuclear ribonucleoprotein [Encephalitozoon cuniculi GB-M1]AGE96120.1 small nuclear ribonucleoprotein [Encephalitozoon cuniculi]KMV66708.1 small nuclear ribonucleoprotein [Encephalitozoon cuniculi EcunIII-L]UYI28423.1 small nuclear ribonucleoprotein [Encephalitozoon cuniculi]CAD24924.1 SMALL NUCLEAR RIBONUCLEOPROTEIN (U1/U2 snRNP) [Encephalitozoon cuniculi GB-M1]
MKLVRVLRKCKNERVKIETKEGRRIEGKIVSVDKTMNVEMVDVVVDGAPASTYTVRGSSIRYVLFRDDIDFKPLLVDDRPRNRARGQETGKAKRRKTGV